MEEGKPEDKYQKIKFCGQEYLVNLPFDWWFDGSFASFLIDDSKPDFDRAGWTW